MLVNWAALLRYGAHARELAGGEPATTNNRMELAGVVSGSSEDSHEALSSDADPKDEIGWRMGAADPAYVAAVQAAISALAALKAPCEITLFTDSEYLRQGITDWLPRWKANNWHTVERKPMKNEDLWQRLQ